MDNSTEKEKKRQSNYRERQKLKFFNEGHEAGYQLCLDEETKDITQREFGYLAYLVMQDSQISHERGGQLCYKLSNF